MIDARGFSRNVFSLGTSAAVSTAVNLFLLPFVVHYAGRELYGLYVLVMTLTGYFALLDLGVDSSVVKYGAEAIGRNDDEALGRVASNALTFYLGVGLVGAALLGVSAFLFDRLFAVDPAHVEPVRRMLLVAMVASLGIWPGTVFRGTLQAMQRFDIEAAISIGSRLATVALAVSLLPRGYGIVTFFAVDRAVTLAGFGVRYVVLSRLRPRLRLRVPFWDSAVARSMFGFGLFVCLDLIAGIVVFQLDNLVVATFISAAAVTTYAVGTTVQSAFRTAHGFLAGPIWPAIAQLEGQGGYDDQRRVLLAGTRYYTLMYLPGVALAIVFAAPVIVGWMGPQFGDSVRPAQFLLSYWFFYAMVGVGSPVLTAKGLVKPMFFIQCAQAIANLGLSLMLVRTMGITGVAIGTAGPMAMISLPLTLGLILRTFQVPLREFVRIGLSGGLTAAALAVAMGVVLRSVWPAGSLLMALGQMTAVYAVAVACTAFWWFSGSERLRIRQLVWPAASTA